MMNKNGPPWKKVERERADRMAETIGCIVCQLQDGVRGRCDNRHHIKNGTKAMGHWYTLPLCLAHHADCHNGTLNHAEQIDYWLKVQHILGLPDDLPVSKIVPRRVA